MKIKINCITLTFGTNIAKLDSVISGFEDITLWHKLIVPAIILSKAGMGMGNYILNSCEFMIICDTIWLV